MHFSFSTILWFSQITILQYVTQDLKLKKKKSLYIDTSIPVQSYSFVCKRKISQVCVFFVTVSNKIMYLSPENHRKTTF